LIFGILSEIQLILSILILFILNIDWNETEEDQETHLWEDNWDDEDVEDDFSKQLRLVNSHNSHALFI